MNIKLFGRMTLAWAILVSGAACVKKRPVVDGQTENLAELVAINSVTGQTCEIHTTDIRQKLNVSGAQKVDINTGSAVGIRSEDLVNFTSTCPFLANNSANVELLGAPNTTYKARYEVDANNLTLFKLVTADQLSHLERPYAQAEGSLWKVPIGGFKIMGFFDIGRAKNADNRDTNVQIRIPIDNKNFRSATHLTINKEEFVTFKRLAKTDVLPKTYFKGQWYYAQTVINTRFLSGQVGAITNDDANFSPASKIEFEMEKSFLIAVNVNVDARLRSKEHNLNLDTAIRIPVRNVDYRRVPLGSGYDLSEEEIQTKTPGDARFLELKLADAETLESVTDATMLRSIFSLFRRKLNELVILKDLVIRDNYFSFTLENRGDDQETRYSFLRITDDRITFAPRHAFRDDMEKFGYFTSFKNVIIDDKIRSQADVENVTYLNRFNPDSEIVYHFSNATPTDGWIRDIGREAINIWQQAFKKAGLTTKIRLEDDPSSDQALGDIRYNLININGDDTGGVIGLGPSLADSQSGEVLSATANLYLQSDRNIILSTLQRWIGEQIGQRFDFTDPANIDPAIEKTKRLTLAIQLPLYNGVTKERIKMPSVYSWSDDSRAVVKYGPLVSNQEIQELSQGKFTSIEELYPSLSAVGGHSYSDLQMQDRAQYGGTLSIDKFVKESPACEGVRKLVEKYKGASTIPSTDELVSVTRPCSLPFTQFSALAALVHELGHNLGLRHNFMGSRDVANYLPASAYSLKYIHIPDDINSAQTSSIMDYLSHEEDGGIQVYPGGYDLAALRFGYLAQVQTQNGDWQAIAANKSITDNLGGDTHPYFYCTDEHAMVGADPFCAPFDTGASSLLNVNRAANMIFRTLSGTYRYQSAFDLWTRNVGILPQMEAMEMVTLKTHYDRWRILVAQEMSDSQRYLQGVTTEQYQAVIDKLLNSPRKAEVEDLLKARNTAVLTLIDLAFTANRYCVSEGANGQSILKELSLIRKDLQRLGGLGRIESCHNPEVVNYLKGRGLILKDEVGFDLEPGSYDLDPVKSAANPDFYGTEPIRMAAASFLTGRQSSLRINAEQGFAPSMMDEPDIRELVTALIKYRLMNGVFIPAKAIDIESYAQARLLNVDDFKARVKNSEGQPQRFINYLKESDLLVFMAAKMQNSLVVPEDMGESAERLAPYETLVTKNPEVMKDRIKNIKQLDTTTFVATTMGSPQSFASQMIDKIKNLDQVKALAQLPVEQITGTAQSLGKFLADNKLMLKTSGATKLDFVRYYSALQSVAQNMASKNQAVQAQFMAMFAAQDGKEFNQILEQDVGPVVQKLGFDANGLPELIGRLTSGEAPKTDGETAIANVLNQPLAVEDFDKGTYPDADGVKSRSDEIIAVVQSSKDAFAQSAEELDAQKNVLSKLLLGFSEK